MEDLDLQSNLPFRFKLSVRAWHPELRNPSDITTGLGMNAKHSWALGEQRATPRGHLLDGRRTQTFWVSESYSGTAVDFLNILNGLVDKLSLSKEFLLEFSDSGGKVEIFVGWFASEVSGGDSIPWQTLESISLLRVNLSLDVYGC